MCHSQEQKDIAQEVISTLDNNGTFKNPIVTEVVDLKDYYRA